MHTLPINGVELAYDEAGEGFPLVLLHAGIADHRMWDDTWPALTDRYRCIRPDLRGFGDTPLPDGEFSWAADMVELLHALGVERAHVIGVSNGGGIALDLALAHPELVERLVLVAAGLPGWKWSETMDAANAAEEAAWESGDLDETAWVNVRTWVDGPYRGPDEVAPELRHRVFEMQRRALDHDNDDARATWLVEDRRAALPSLAAPALVLVGELDLPDFDDIGAVIAAEAVNCRLVRMPGVAHMPPMEAPDAFIGLVVPFLEGK